MRGAVRVQSYAEPPESLAEHRQWQLRDVAAAEGAERSVQVREAAWDGRVLRASLEGVADRDAAERLRGCAVLIEREARPALQPREYFREDLLGFAVRNGAGVLLGSLQHFVDAPAGVLMVVRGERERWLPAGAPYLRRVDLARRTIEVEWPEDI